MTPILTFFVMRLVATPLRSCVTGMYTSLHSSISPLNRVKLLVPRDWDHVIPDVRARVGGVGTGAAWTARRAGRAAVRT